MNVTNTNKRDENWLTRAYVTTGRATDLYSTHYMQKCAIKLESYASVDCAYSVQTVLSLLYSLSLCFVFLCPLVLCVVLFIFCLCVLLWALLPELK